MQTPDHALRMWIVEDTIRILYPDGQLLSIPALEPSRLVAILRSQVPRTPGRALGWRDHFISQFGTKAEKDEYVEAKRRGAEVRAKEGARVERERAARLRKVAKRDQLKEAQRILDVVGL